MAKKFDIKKRDEEAKREIKILENEVFHARKRAAKLWESWHHAEDEGDKERTQRLYDAWKREREAIRRMDGRLHYLGIITAEHKYANQHFYSDIKPWEVIEELSECRIVVRSMKATLKEDARKALQDSFSLGGFFGHTDNDLQAWKIESDENGRVLELRRHKDGHFYETGDTHTPFVLALEPYKYYDYNF